VIGVEQNTDKQLLRLAAQRQLYATAKRVFGWQLLVGGPIAVGTALLGIALPAVKGYVALWGMVVAAADLFWLTPWQRRLREQAARIQEAFDCDVLRLEWNGLKAGAPPDPELVREQADKYAPHAGSMPPLRDWYAKEVDTVPLHIGRIACQRSSCWWDSNQRRRYAALVIGGVAAVVVAVWGVALLSPMTIEDFVLKVAAPLAPAMLLGVRQYREQTEAASRGDRLKTHAEQLWRDALAGGNEPDITRRSRGLQDEIFDNRRSSPLVFDAIYRRLQGGYEVQMNHGVGDLVADARKILGTGSN
jgi:hypothetical protein